MCREESVTLCRKSGLTGGVTVEMLSPRPLGAPAAAAVHTHFSLRPRLTLRICSPHCPWLLATGSDRSRETK